MTRVVSGGGEGEICIKEVKINFENPTDQMTEGNSTKEGHLHIWLFNKSYE